MKFVASLIVVLLLFTAGCAHLHSARSLEPGVTPVLSDEEVIIFGRIRSRVNGEEKEKSILRLQSRSPVLVPGDSVPKIVQIWPVLKTQSAGTFFYIIPAGHWELLTVAPYDFSIGYLEPEYAFTVADPRVAYYIGDVEIDFGRILLNLRYNDMQVRDRYDEALGHMRGLLQVAPLAETRKALLTPIPGRSPHMEYPGGGAGFSFGTLKW